MIPRNPSASSLHPKAADVKGYRSLMSQDEEATVKKPESSIEQRFLDL